VVVGDGGGDSQSTLDPTERDSGVLFRRLRWFGVDDEVVDSTAIFVATAMGGIGAVSTVISAVTMTGVTVEGGDGARMAVASSTTAAGDDGAESKSDPCRTLMGDGGAESDMRDMVSSASGSRIIPVSLTWKLIVLIVRLNP
jgi:hypothetical protein